jgi:hypothetical protein
MPFGTSTVTLGGSVILCMAIEAPRSRMHLPRGYRNDEPFDKFPELLGVEDGERLVHRLPSHMVETLAQMTEEGVLASSGKWAATDELRCQPSDVQPIIEGLIQLSRGALARAKGVYLWNCV